MNDQISPEQYQSIKEFASELTTCFLAYQNTHHDAFSDIVLNYAMQVIDIHLNLANLQVDTYLCNLEKAMNKNVDNPK